MTSMIKSSRKIQFGEATYPTELARITLILVTLVPPAVTPHTAHALLEL